MADCIGKIRTYSIDSRYDRYKVATLISIFIKQAAYALPVLFSIAH